MQCAAVSGILLTESSGAVGIAAHPSRISDVELWSAIDLRRPGLEDVERAVAEQNWGQAGAAWLDYMRSRQTPTMHIDRRTWPDIVRRQMPQLVEPILAEADRIVAGDIVHGPYVLRVENEQIQWLENPTNDTNYVSVVGSQWFLNALGRAYLLSGDERYAETFAWIFESWYDHQIKIREKQGGLGFDPIFRAYYPGIRARILADNVYCLAESDALTPDIHSKLLKALLGAASWLHAQESRGYRVGNQQVAAALGCGVVGYFLPEFRDAERWIELAERRMQQHMQDDFFADGGHRELCTQYHKTVLRDVGYVALLAQANGRPGLFADPKAGRGMERAYEWLAKLVMPTGQTPALHSAVFATDVAVHLELGGRHFQRADFAWLADRFWEKQSVPTQKSPFAFANYMIASPGPEVARPSPQPPDWLSVHLEDSGIAIMRTGWDPSDRYLLVQYGWANTGHAYPGALHFTYEVNGELVATAPGSPRSYRHPAYAYCHSTPSHNVVSIDGTSYPGQPAPGGELDVVADLPGAWLFSGHHTGYEKPFGVIIHRDILAVKDGPVLIRDRVVGGDGHEARWGFHTPLDMQIVDNHRVNLQGARHYTLAEARPESISTTSTERRWAAVLPRDCQPDDCGAEVNVFRWHKPIAGDGATFMVALIEGEGTIEAVGDTAYRVVAGEQTWLVVFCSAQTSTAVGEVTAAARCACIQWSHNKLHQAWIFDGTALNAPGIAWTGVRQSITQVLHD